MASSSSEQPSGTESEPHGFMDQAHMGLAPYTVRFRGGHNGIETRGVVRAIDDSKADTFTIAISEGGLPGCSPLVTKAFFDRLSENPQFDRACRILERPLSYAYCKSPIFLPMAGQWQEPVIKKFNITDRISLDFTLPIRCLDPHKKLGPGFTSRMTLKCRFVCFVTPDSLNNPIHGDDGGETIDMWMPSYHRHIAKAKDHSGRWFVKPIFSIGIRKILIPAEASFRLATIRDRDLEASG